MGMTLTKTGSGLYVRRFDYDKETYANPDAQTREVELAVGSQVEEICKQHYGRFDSRTVTRYMKDAGVRMHDIYNQFSWQGRKMDYANLGSYSLRAVLSNSGLNPFFGPETQTTILEGMNDVFAQYQSLISTTINLDRQSIQSYFLTNLDTADDYTLKGTGQGAEIPVATITLGEQVIQLTKKTRGIEWVDEAQDAPIDLGMLWLRNLGIRMGKSYSGLLIHRLIYGYFDDGSDDAETFNSATAHAFGLQDILTAKMKLRMKGFNPTDLILSPTASIALQVLQWPNGGGAVFPDGIDARVGLTVTENDSMPDTLFAVLDRNAALIRWVNKPFATEDERDASRQVTGTFASVIDQITIGDKRARVLCDNNHS